MDYKKRQIKGYLKFNLLTFLVVFFLFHSVIFVQKVNAGFENIAAVNLYKTAWQTINEKYYFKSKVNLSQWENKFENRIGDLDDAHRCISKLVNSLHDPYTRFLTREEFKDEQDILNSTLVGIGVKLSGDKPIVLDVLPESPAYNSGIKSDDYILAVNNTNTHNLTISQITNLLRGPKDTILTVTIRRNHEIITKTLTRRELQLKAVSTRLLDNGLALVKIDSFIPENTSLVFKDELTKLMSVNGLIIDLRNNSGGLLKNAIEISDMFLSEGKIVSTINQGGKTNEFANSSKLFDKDIIILVNENTASASEIVASALKENKRAILIGKRTFGKGLVQEIVKLPDDSALHVTIAAYLTPSGKNINKVGIIPDEVIYDNDRQLKRAKELLLTLINNRTKTKIASL